MNKKRADQFVRARGDELRRLARVLYDQGVVPDVEPLQQAAATCLVNRIGGEYRWSYQLHRLVFRTLLIKDGGLRHCRPRTLKEISITLDVTLDGKCHDDGALEDPLEELIVDVQIEGVTKGGDVLATAWHLDRHIFGSDDSEPNADEGLPHFVHPHYHFQYGGKHTIGRADKDFGTVLLLDPPRIAHPPLDAILAIDFVLSNYFGGDWYALRRNSGPYNEMLRESQTRLWRPYATATSMFWDRLPEPAWDAQLIWPQLFNFDTDVAV